MKRLHHTWIATVVGSAILLGVLVLGPACVTAQPFPWDPPCTLTKIVNASPCAATLTVNTTAGPVGPFGPVPSGGTLVVPMGTPPVTVLGVFTQAGTAIPAVSPGPVMPPPAPPATLATGWVSNVTLGPAPGCCFDIYFDASSAPGCYIYLVRSTAPPPCTP